MFYPSDETDENRTYKNQNLFEVVLPKTQKNIVNSKFKDNKIRKVNFGDLNSLESIGWSAFQNNKIETIDFSNASSLKKISPAAFLYNQIMGSLIIPPKLETIGSRAFKDNKIEHLNLTNGESFNLFDDECFYGNNIEELDLSLLPKLKRINTQAFFGNNIKTLNLKSNTLSYIGQQAFSNNKDKETAKVYDLIPEGYIFPNIKSYTLWIQVFNRDSSIKGTKTLFVNKTTSIVNSFSYPTNIYKAELDLSIPKYKVELIDGKNTLTFNDDTTIGDVILRQDLIRKLNSIRKIDKYVFPYSSITKFGDGEEFKKTSKRLLGLKKYLGLSDAIDKWVAATANP